MLTTSQALTADNINFEKVPLDQLIKFIEAYTALLDNKKDNNDINLKTLIDMMCSSLEYLYLCQNILQQPEKLNNISIPFNLLKQEISVKTQ